MPVIKISDSTDLKLKKLMKSVKEAGGSLEEQKQAEKILKN